MDDTLEALVKDCVVKLSIAVNDHGTGFFVAPGLILTCAHVVGDRQKGRIFEGDIQVSWKGIEQFATARVASEKWLPSVDAALLRYSICSENIDQPPCVLLGEGFRPRDDLFVYGFPETSPKGSPSTLECEGDNGDDPPLITFKLGNICWGMSGSPVLNIRTGRVCGMVKLTRNPNGLEGGEGVTTKTIYRELPELIDRQDLYHRQGSKWYALAGIKVPGRPLSRLVQTEIEKILSKSRLDLLQKHISNTLKEEHHIQVQSPKEIASKLIGMELDLTLLLMVRRDVTHQLREEGRVDKEIEYVRSAALDIMGWLVLLAVNTAWMAQNRYKLYPQEFPGAMAMPVETDVGIEIIHAVIEQRCARFNSIEGKLFGAQRIPAIDHEFLEEGFDMEDIVRDIKAAIFKHINRKRGLKDRMPDKFTPEVDKRFNAKLRVYNKIDKNVYLVVKRSGSRSPLNDRVYQRLKSDLPDLLVIFQESNQAGDAFVVDEIELDSTLETFFDKES